MSHPAPNIPAGEAPNQAIRIDSDSNSTSASTSDSDDGGMQLDPPELEQIALLRRSGSLENVLSRELYDNQSFDSTDPDSTHPGPSVPRSHTATLRHDAKARNRIREEKNAALAVLTNWELLMTYALANGESIPMTRRRFTAKLIAPGDKPKQEEVIAERWLVPIKDEQGRGGLKLVPGRRRLIVDFDDDSGWRGPQKPRSAGASRSASRSTSRSASMVRSSANLNSGNNKKGRLGRGEGLGSSPLLQQQSVVPTRGWSDGDDEDIELGDAVL